METSPDAPRSPDQMKAEAMARYCEYLKVSPEYFDGKRVLDLGCGDDAWFARALKERGTAADVWAVEAHWLDALDPEKNITYDEAGVRAELGDHALAQDFMLEDLSLGSEVDSIVSVGALSNAVSDVDEVWLPEVQAAARGLLAKLAVGGELRFGRVPKMLDEANGGHGYSRIVAALAAMDGDGFETRLEPISEEPERNLAFELAVVKRVK